MEALDQLDLSNPDHVSVITRDGKMTVSIKKAGGTITISNSLKGDWLDTTPRPPLQQPAPKLMAVKGGQGKSSALKLVSTKPKPKQARRSPSGNPKLNAQDVKEIKQLLADKEFMASFGSKSKAYTQIGKGYGVSLFTITNIDKGLAWRQVTI